jgi:glycosyltransferase involved in cell wall biosynthesis
VKDGIDQVPNDVRGPSLTRVTAIMPAYNAEATIATAIESVRRQSMTEWELIVVDDGSTDGTLEVARRVASRDERIRVIDARHGGRGEARNRCLDLARGSFVAICDSDDISLARRFEQQVRYFEDHPDVHVVSSARVVCFTPDHRRAFAATAPATDAAIRQTFDRRRMPIFFASAMLRADVFHRHGQFDEELHRNQDYGFFARFYRTLRFGTIPESLILYRTSALTTDRRVVAENNFFRYCANRRASGDTRSALEIASTLSGQAYRALVIPSQYAWYVVKRHLLGRGVDKLTGAEEQLLAATLSSFNGREESSAAAIKGWTP